MEIQITGLEGLEQAAKALLNYAEGRKKFLFYGEIGAGKTTFIKTLCRVIGITETVTSPTFSLINMYLTQTKETVYHIDLYRLKQLQEAIDIGIEDQLYDSNYCFIEWAELIAPILPEEVVHVRVEALEDESRQLVLSLDA